MSDTGQLPTEAQLFQTLFGFMVTRTLSAVAELNVADALRDGPRSYTDLAQAVGADQRSLHRAVRMLVSTGMFAEPEPGTFALTPVSDLLRSNVPGSMRDMGGDDHGRIPLAAVGTVHGHVTVGAVRATARIWHRRLLVVPARRGWLGMGFTLRAGSAPAGRDRDGRGTCGRSGRVEPRAARGTCRTPAE